MPRFVTHPSAHWAHRQGIRRTKPVTKVPAITALAKAVMPQAQQLDASHEAVDSGILRASVTNWATKGACSHVFLQDSSPAGTDGMQPATPQLVRTLGVLNDALAAVNTRLLVVPLTRCGGWEADCESNPPVVRAQGSPAMQPVPLQPSVSRPEAGGVRAEPIQLPLVLWPTTPTQPTASQSDEKVLSFSRVAVGGTFDRLHCGHALLLATTALVATERVYVGVTADQLLASKKYKELLQSYTQRKGAAVDFMRAVHPSLLIESGALEDPKAPTQAELDPLMGALVVSQETLPGAHSINQGRAARGFPPLVIVVVPVIGLSLGAEAKLSSTQLRAEEAAVAAAGHMPLI